MARLRFRFGGRAPYVLTLLWFAAALFFNDAELPLPSAGGCNGGRTSAVGGVRIDPSGAIQRLEVDHLKQLSREWNAALTAADADMQKPSDLRKISLRKLEAALSENIHHGRPIPDALKLLAGLQKVEYVFVYPEQHDIVLAGFGEGWKMDDRGNVVGRTTGQPVLLLDDLLTALRYSEAASQGGIYCSIDPTPEGQQRLNQQSAAIGRMSDPVVAGRMIQEALGPQVITVGGVPRTAHLAHVLVAADYRMKRIGMNLDPSPVAGLVSYLNMLGSAGRGVSAVAPRWWLEPDFQPVRTDADGLAFALRGGTVKCLTEENFVAGNGPAKALAGKANPAAQRWADLMTEKYAALAAREPVFAQLQSIMDLAVVGALIAQENLAARSGHDFALLFDAAALPTDDLEPVKQTDTVIGMLRRGDNLILSASGGVQINAWSIAGRKQTDEAVGRVRTSAAAGDDRRWWWN